MEHQLSRKKRNYVMSGEQPVQDSLIKTGPGNNNLDLTIFLLSHPHQLSPKEARSFQSLPVQPMQVGLRAESRLEKDGEETQRADGSIQQRGCKTFRAGPFTASSATHLISASSRGAVRHPGQSHSFTTSSPIPLISFLLISPIDSGAATWHRKSKILCSRKSKTSQTSQNFPK